MLLSNRLLVVLVWRFDVVHVHDLSHPLHPVPRHFQHREHERQVRSELEIRAVLLQVLVVDTSVKAVPERPEMTGYPITLPHCGSIHRTQVQLPLPQNVVLAGKLHK
jgi:hypothetical protein